MSTNTNDQLPLFSFGIITDTHIRPPQGDASSPFPVNDLANERARYAVSLLAAQSPAFTIHLGDMVHTLPSMPGYDDACAEAHTILNPLRPDLYFVAGNHDIGDKPMPDSPAVGVTDQGSALYKRHFGESWYSFAHHDAVFVIINSSVVNTGSADELAQKGWLEETLAENAGKRLFLFSHYPPFIHHQTEQEHYDNYAEPGRSWLLDLINQYSPEVVFSGHVHHFFCNWMANTALYCLPPTSFIRQDYAELFRVEPSSEYGRNDPGKMSVVVVDIYPVHHALRLLPTDGKLQSEQQDSARVIPAPTPKSCTVHLRHAWHESIDLPYNGPMEEFARKRVRNDYPLLRLIQMGISDVRIPLTDLLSDQSRLRMQDYARLGIRFHLFHLGIPTETAIRAVLEHDDLVTTFECVSPSLDLAKLDMGKLKSLKRVFLSKAHSSADTHTDGKPFAHSVSTGFLAEEIPDVLSFIAVNKRYPALSGVVFQIPLETKLSSSLNEMEELFATSGLTGIANIRLAHSNPAEANFDDEAIARRVSEAFELGNNLQYLTLQFDTFQDIDRGYNPRHGLIDRLCNFRKAGRRLANS